MLQITWHGLSCFQIKSRPQTHDVNLVIDPYTNASGLRFSKTMEAAIVVSSSNSPNHNNFKDVGGKPFMVDGPGEFEVQGVFVYGISAPKDDATQKDRHTIYKIETEGISVAHLGSLNRELTDEELGQLQNIDVLMIPVGGGGVLTAKKAATVVNQIEPRLVVPMYYNIPGVKEKLTGVESFVKELGAKKEEGNKLKLARKDLPQDETVVYILAKS